MTDETKDDDDRQPEPQVEAPAPVEFEITGMHEDKIAGVKDAP